MSGWCCAPASCVILGWLCRPVLACRDTLVPLASVPFSRIALGLALALCPDWICLLGFHFFPISVFSPVLSSCLSSGVWLCKRFCPGGPLCGWATPHFQGPFIRKRDWNMGGLQTRSLFAISFLFFFKLIFRYSSPKSPSSPFFYEPVPQFCSSVSCLVTGILKNKIRRSCKRPLIESLVCLWDQTRTVHTYNAGLPTSFG